MTFKKAKLTRLRFFYIERNKNMRYSTTRIRAPSIFCVQPAVIRIKYFK